MVSKQDPRKGGHIGLNGLTTQPHRIHSATADDDPETHTEAERLMLRAFFETLADVALSVATRDLGEGESDR